MLIKKNEPDNYNLSNIQINGNFITWEDHILCLSGISRLWSGNLPEKQFPVKTALILFFLSFASPYIGINIILLSLLAVGATIWISYHKPDNQVKQVHIELHSGRIITFTADSEEAVTQFLNHIAGIDDLHSIEESKSPENLDETNENTSIETEEVPVQESDAIEFIGKDNLQLPLIQELQKLFDHISEKPDGSDEILHLINDTARYVKSGDIKELSATLKKFVTLGLINDCNELGLSNLIQEIKSKLY